MAEFVIRPGIFDQNAKTSLIEDLIKEVLSTHKRLRCRDIITTTEFISKKKWDDESLYNFLICSNLKTLVGKTYLSYNLTLEDYVVHQKYQKIKKLVDSLPLPRVDQKSEKSYSYFKNFYHTLLSNPSSFRRQTHRLLNYYHIKGVQYFNHDSKRSVLDIFLDHIHENEI